MANILDKRYRPTVAACCMTSVATSVTGNLTPLLFLTFRELYGVSFWQMGLLVLINFTTQLLVDLLFSFFSSKLRPELAVRLTPAVIAVGLWTFALCPRLLPQNAFAWLLVGTVIFSAGSGLAEVLTSPTVSAVPSNNGERLLSGLHASYAWGVVAVVSLATVFLFFVGGEMWYVLPLVFSVIPLVAFAMFLLSPMPSLSFGAEGGAERAPRMPRGLVALCVLCIFFGGAAECTMAQWCSGYIEAALGIEKVWGDLFGVALFAAMLGLGRTLYGAVGKHIRPCLFYGFLGAAACYILAVVSPYPIVGLIACALTGFCVSMLWPGSLIYATDRMPRAGVALFALMAAGGDLGAALVPQGVGAIVDAALVSPTLLALAERLSLTPDALGMKLGLLVACLFPLLGALTMHLLHRSAKRATNPVASCEK